MSITALEGHHQIVNRYGYTGEWWEDEVGLLYLRARWYAPETGSFLSRDSVEGEPPYLYVRGNPVTLADPSGQDPCTDDDPLTICHTPPIGGGTPTIPPDPISTSPRPLPPISVPDSRCTGAPYVECAPPPPPPGPQVMPVPLSLRGAHPDCGGCNFKAGGYSEGYSGYLNLFTILPLVAGYETVYDFATMERAKFEFHTMHVSEGSPFTGVSTGFLEGGISAAYVQLYDFKSWESIEADYSGRFDGYMVGANSTGLQGGAGYINVWSSDPATGQPGVSGAGLYLLLGVGVDTPLPPVSGSRFATFYTLEGNHQWYTTTGTETGIVSKSLMELMQQDIRSGNYLPMPFNWPGLNQATDVLGVFSRHIAANNLRQVWDTHTDYFTEYFSKCRAAAPK